MTATIWLQILVLVAIAALIPISKYWLSAYITSKGKNLATKEDIGEITTKIESVKAVYAHELECFRAVVESRLGIHQFRYRREYQMLVQLSERVVELRDATSCLRPELEYVRPGESEPDRRQRKLDRYSDAARALYTYYEPRRPFFAESLREPLRLLNQVTLVESIQYRLHSPQHGAGDLKYWETAMANAGKVEAAAEAVLAAVRDRAQSWEELFRDQESPNNRMHPTGCAGG